MKLLFSILLLSLTLSIFAQTQIQQANQILQLRGEIVVKFNVATIDQINTDLTNIMSIDNVKPSVDGGFDVIAYANESEFQTFLSRNIPYEIIPKNIPKALNMATTVAQMASWDRYPTYNVYEQMLADFAINYPTLCDIDTIMNSTPSGNYRILVARISDNVNTPENEPQFLYSSSMHGDETTGYYLMLRLINYLLSNYNSISQVTNIVNGIEIWICPLANPEGTYYLSSPVGSTVANSRRFNLADVDLNRNYKDPRDGDHPDGNAWQPETQAFMTFANNHHFNMGANFHGGAEVMNYPWDTWTTSGNPNADAAWWERVCTNYVTTARSVTAGYMTDTYADGVSEGGDWYVITGGRQDYMNYFHQCREVTIELDGDKTTPTENLNGMWNTNYQSLLNYMQESMYGIRGVVTDSCTGQPIRAKIFAISYDQANDSSHVYSALPVGNYHKYVNTGTYNLTFSAPGYVSKTITGISVTNGVATTCNVAIVPLAPTVDFSADVTSTCSGVVQFDNQSTFPQGSTFLWNFGDGQTSTLENPTHTYTGNGTYTVKLKIMTCAGNDSLTRTSYISVSMPTAPSTTNDEICGTGTLTLTASGSGTIQWYDAATGGNLAGTGSPWVTPVLSSTTTYYAASESTTYGASQHVGMTDNSGGGQYFTNTTAYRYMIFDVDQDIRLESVRVYANTAGNRTIYLQNSSGATIDSTVVNIPTGQNPYLVTLNFDISAGTGYRLGVKTGTGNNLYIASGPSYPYTVPGVISITGNNQNQSYFYFFFDWIVKTASVCSSPRTAAVATVYPQPVASFSSSAAGSSVTFTNTSTNATTWNWTFGDGNSSTQQHPSHTYAAPGTYLVTLIITGTGGCADTISQNVVLSLGQPPVAAFYADTICVGGTTHFTDESDPAFGVLTNWNWNFGDGTGNSTLQNPSHIFADTGMYAVTLIVQNDLGLFDTTTAPVYVTTRPLSAFSYLSGFVGEPTYFSDLSQSYVIPLTGWQWSFGDATQSTLQHPEHIYNSEGNFGVILIASNACGSDTSNQTVNILASALNEKGDVVSIFPNPAPEGFIHIQYPSSAQGTIIIRLFASDGRLLLTEQRSVDAGQNQMMLNISSFNDGLYLIEIYGEMGLWRQPLIK